MKVSIIIFAGLVLLYYGFLDFNLFYSEIPTSALRNRLGTILWNDSKTANHTYCYYPGESVRHFGKNNGQIIKQVTSFQECQGWYGIKDSSY